MLRPHRSRQPYLDKTPVVVRGTLPRPHLGFPVAEKGFRHRLARRRTAGVLGFRFQARNGLPLAGWSHPREWLGRASVPVEDLCWRQNRPESALPVAPQATWFQNGLPLATWLHSRKWLGRASFTVEAPR